MVETEESLSRAAQDAEREFERADAALETAHSDHAAAERALAQRRRVTTLLTRHGVEVVDAVPAELPPALADRYLALKAVGRL